MKGERWLASASALIAGMALALAGLYPGNNPDTFGHLAQGRQIAQLGHVPQFDTWSLLPGPPRPWLNYEWLSDLGTWELFSLFGYPAVTLFKCALLMFTALCLARCAQQWAGERAMVLTSLALLSTIPAIRYRLSDRPHVLGIALAAASTLLLTQLAVFRTGDRRRAHLIAGALVLLHLLWVNAHASHLLGIGITAAYLVFGDAATRSWYAAIVALELLASCVSPYGPRIWVDAIDHMIDPRYRELISEWWPLGENAPAWLKLGPVLQAAAITLLLPRLRSSVPRAHANLAVCVVLGAACFRSQRFVPEFMLLSSPLLGAGLTSVLGKLELRRFAGIAAISALVLALALPFACAQLPPYRGIGLRATFDGLPFAAGKLLAEHGAVPRVFGAMQDSWYLMYAAPKSRFVIDGRTPFYGPEWVARVRDAFLERDSFDKMQRELSFNTVIVRYTTPVEQEIVRYLDRFRLVLIEDSQATYVLEGALDSATMKDLPALRVLRPSFDVEWIVGLTPQQEVLAREELSRIAKLPNTDGYRAWVEGVLELAPLRRGLAQDGFRWPRDDDDWARYRRARPLIQHAAARVSEEPIVAAFEATMAATFCEFDLADDALVRALSRGPSRAPLLAAQEIALRRGQLEQVRRAVTAARLLPQGQGDPWLAQLAEGIEQPPACPER